MLACTAVVKRKLFGVDTKTLEEELVDHVLVAEFNNGLATSRQTSLAVVDVMGRAEVHEVAVLASAEHGR